eukprot:1271428-Alexandrium_andersonii.AAC.1
MASSPTHTHSPPARPTSSTCYRYVFTCSDMFRSGAASTCSDAWAQYTCACRAGSRLTWLTDASAAGMPGRFRAPRNDV